jgi:hypothetical protein
VGSEGDVEVLLATCNGERYIREQVDSILGQDDASVRVLARDDGSTDKTREILMDYAARFPKRFRLLPDYAATGSAKQNFLRLMNTSCGKYVCFADQDDVWQPGKVSVTKAAMNRLEARWGESTPLLVFSDLRVVDDSLNTIKDSFWRHEKLDPRRIYDLGALLGQNVVTGCTVMVNRPLLELALRMPPEAYMHDQWVSLLAAALGRAMPVERATVLYRQHASNVVGAARRNLSLSSFLRRIRNRNARQNQWDISQRQAAAFLRIYEAELPIKSRQVLHAYLRCGTTRNPLLRSYLLIRHGFLRTGLFEKLATLADQWINFG